MIFISINNFINKDIMVNRFHRDPQMKCGELLLQEKIPLNLLYPRKENLEEIRIMPKKLPWKSRVYSKMIYVKLNVIYYLQTPIL